MPAQTSDTAAVCTPVAGRERRTSASTAAAAESAPSTPPASSAVSRLALFRGIAPDDAAEAPAAAAARSDGALPWEQSLAPPTPLSRLALLRGIAPDDAGCHPRH